MKSVLKNIDKPVRIRYNKPLPDRPYYKSSQQFLATEGKLLHVKITAVGPFSVMICENEQVVERVDELTFTKAKAKAKELLKKYGVNFYDEVRTKKV